MKNDYFDYLQHSGVKGQKWGERRWQNEDGSLTPEGYEHYGYGQNGGRNSREPAPRSTADVINIARQTRQQYYNTTDQIGYKASKFIERNKQTLMLIGGVAAVTGMALLISKTGSKTISDAAKSKDTDKGKNAAEKAASAISKQTMKNLNKKTSQKHDAKIWHEFVSKHRANYTAVKAKNNRIASMNLTACKKYNVTRLSTSSRGPKIDNNANYIKRLKKVGKVFSD